MALLVQIFAPLEGTYYDRALYVFGCKKPSCRRREGSIRAIRGVKRDSEKEKIEKEKEEEEVKKKEEEANRAKKVDSSIGDKIFDTSSSSNPFASANPFGGNPFETAPFESKGKEKEKKKANSAVDTSAAKTKTATTTSSTIFPSFPGYFIQVEGEILTPRKLEPVNVEIDTDDNPSSSSADLGRAADMAGANIDPVFQKFVELVDNNPDQVLRYQRPSVPILYSSKDNIIDIFKNNHIPKCPVTGDDRILELQIMPHSIMILEESYQEDDIIANGMEWGTIFIATSENDIMPKLDNGVGYVEEWVGVQWEEVVTH